MSVDVHPVLASLSPTRREMLDLLKKQGDMTAEDLARALGLTASAVRQQLTALQRDGLVAFAEVRDGPGRPRHRYHLTAAADGLYPRTYAQLTNELLDYVGQADPDLIEQVFRQRRQRRIEGAISRLADKDLAGKVTELAHILDEDGYLAEAVPRGDGTFLIVEHNCAILGIALRYGQACGTEIDFIRAVLPEATVERVSHMVLGAHNCSYVVKPKP